jgi:hypothetical protein
MAELGPETPMACMDLVLDDGGMPDQWTRIDDLMVNARYLLALMEIRAVFAVGIAEAIDIFDERYPLLRQERPDDFTLASEGYGRDIYT